MAVSADGQCPAEFTKVVVNDLETKRILINVEGALNNDLSNRSQGLCGVNINFKVNFPGDIGMTIISPDGTAVQIIGPIGTSQGPILPFLSGGWDISFVPCGEQATPDGNFSDVWNNDQAWDNTLVPYSGSYYPYLDCLEDFDSGAVNGQWTIVIEDGEPQGDPTEILDIELIFCDDSGLVCQKCDALAGFLPTNLNTGCEGADDLNLNTLDPYFGLTPPDPLSYSYLYAVTDLNTQTVIALLPEPDFRSLAVGNYEICGISVLQDQQIPIETEIIGRNLTDFRTLLQDGTLSFCADLVLNCFEVTIQVSDEPDLQFDIQDLTCLTSETSPVFIGANLPSSISWTYPDGSIQFEPMPLMTMPGDYQVTANGPTGCISSRVYPVVQDLTLPTITIADPGELSCSTPTHVLNTSPVLNYASQSWTGPDGYTSTELSPTVAAAGMYDFQGVTVSGCNVGASITVAQGNTSESVTIQDPGPLSCQSPSVILSLIPALSYTSQSWTGPDGYTSTDLSPTIAAAGIYDFQGITVSGCNVGASITVAQGNTSESVTIQDPGPLSCQSSSVTLSLTPALSYTSQSWTGPDGYTSTELSPTVSAAGMYDFQGVTVSGCNVGASITVAQGNTSESVTIQDPGPLSCQSPSVTLSLTPALSYTSQSWTGPDGYTSTDLSPTVAAAGMYDFLGVTVSGCTVGASITVAQGNTSESVAIVDPGPLSCQSPSVTLSLTPALSYISQSWTGPEGYTSTELSPTVAAAGMYDFQGVTVSGCNVAAAITIAEDANTESVSIIDPGTLSCTVPSLILTVDSDAVIDSYEWTGPNGFMSSDPNPSISLPGTYDLLVTTNQSCVLTAASLEVTQDADLPDISIVDPGPIICGLGSVDLEIDGIAALSSTEWSGPNNFMSNAPSITVDVLGLYTLTGQTPGGCTVTAGIEVIASNVPPTVILPDNGNVIRTQCMDEYPVQIEVMDAYQDISWEGPNGFMASGLNVNLIDTGLYRITTIGQGTCEDVSTIRLTVTDDYPELSLSVENTMDCNAPQTTVSVSSDITINNYLWDGPSPVVGGGADVGVVSNGMYKVTVTAMNNCKTVDSIMVTSVGLSTMGITDVDVQMMDPSCAGFNDGSIAITNIDGGIGPYSLNINNLSFEIDDVISNLGSGDYTLEITDINNCTFETVISLVDGSTIDISMDEEYSVVFGETLTIRPEVVSSSPDYSLDWQVNSPFTTTDSTISFQPLFSLPLIVTIMNETGCTQSDTTLIAVDKQIDIYVPNVFVPGSVNNGMYGIVPGRAVELIKSFSIFDRWGHTLFRQQDFLPAESEGLWDGTYRGELVAQGVYIYLAEVQLIDGSLIQQKGTFTLLK